MEFGFAGSSDPCGGAFGGSSSSRRSSWASQSPSIAPLIWGFSSSSPSSLFLRLPQLPLPPLLLRHPPLPFAYPLSVHLLPYVCLLRFQFPCLLLGCFQLLTEHVQLGGLFGQEDWSPSWSSKLQIQDVSSLRIAFLRILHL